MTSIVDSGVEPQGKQIKRISTAQSDRGFRCPLTESLKNLERVNLHVYTKNPFWFAGWSGA